MAGHIDSINKAFAAETSLRKRIYSAIDNHPEQANLFADIGDFILHRDAVHSTSNGVGSTPSVGGDEPPSKKRRLQGESEQISSSTQSQPSSSPGRLVFEARDISFSLPQRKKLHLGILEHGSAVGQHSYSIQLRNPATNQVDGVYPLSSYGYALRLPVPEKNQKQYNFCLLPPSEKSGSIEPIIWTVNHGPLKSYKIETPELKAAAPEPDDVLENTLKFCLKGTSVQLTLPTETEFASAVRESHRKSDIAYHVKAFRGSKEGYLFFLENGIFFGFKKPLSFFSFQEIESISYTSVLQRTFNLNITIRPHSEAETQEIEYSMLDQQDFAGIDTYIKNHQLQDASLAEARRAKKTGKAGNTTTTTEANGGDEADDRTELEKAQAELEDEEDEMEEDYDPDEDEDDDDDSGSDSDSGADEVKYTRGRGRNLVAEELGSEAEDVSVTEDEDEDVDDQGEEGEGDEEEEEDDVDELQADNQSKATSMPSHPHPPPPTSKPPPRAPTHRNPNAPDLDDEDQL